MNVTQGMRGVDLQCYTFATLHTFQIVVVFYSFRQPERLQILAVCCHLSNNLNKQKPQFFQRFLLCQIPSEREFESPQTTLLFLVSYSAIDEISRNAASLKSHNSKIVVS